MAGRIRDEDIALVRERSAIDEVVAEYLQLRHSGGGSLKGLCPFHDEKTPSFNVTPARGLWYCFSEAEGGDVIKFIQKIDNLSFVEAVERLAARAGIELRYEQGGQVPGQEQSQRRRLTAANAAAAEFFAERLRSPAAAPGREFLSARGFELADAERFGAGYAPAEWEALTRHLRGRGFTDAELMTAGLASQGRRGPVDRFRGRLIWPIRDLTGEVIAFGARKLDDREDGPKYLNTPETPLFRKATVLYGADLAKRDIGQRRQAVLVEGYTDVMACHLAGVTTAVATCGTAFGEGHVKIVRRLLMDASEFQGEVIFTFDGDAAGQRAALRAFGLEEKFVTQTFVAVQPDGLDPCDLRLKQGDGAVRDLVARRVPLYEFAIRSALRGFDLETAEGRVGALDAAARYIARIKDEALRKVYAGNLDRWLGLGDQELIMNRVASHLRGRRGREQGRDRDPGWAHSPGRGPRRDRGRGRAASGGPAVLRVGGGLGQQATMPAAPPPRGDEAAERYDPSDPVIQVEREALKLAVQRPVLCGPEFDALGEESFTSSRHAAVFTLIAACGGAAGACGGREWAARLRERAAGDALRSFVTELAVETLWVPRADGEADARYAAAVLARVEELAVSREIAALKSRLQRMSPVDDQSGYNRRFGDLIALEQRRKALLERGAGAG